MASPVEIAPVAYLDVAEGQTGATIEVTSGGGKKGDYLDGLIVYPDSTSPGAVTLIDGTVSVVVFRGGSNSVTSLVPFVIPRGSNSKNGPWKVTTSTSVRVTAVGNFA